MSNQAIPYYLVVPAAGIGSRFGGDLPKQYASINGKPLLHYAIESASSFDGCVGVVVALAAADSYWQAPAALNMPLVTVAGGAERVDSVSNALQWIAANTDADDVLVLVHDAARPYLPRGDVERLLQAASQSDAGALLAAPVADTIKSGKDGVVTDTVDRSQLWRALTPQAFRLSILQQALLQAAEQGIRVTDEASAVECLGLQPALVQGSAANIKVTLPEDLLTVSAQLGAVV